MPLRLVATTGSPSVRLPPSRRPVVVGRMMGCDLPLRDPTVSRRHAEMEPAAGELLVRDLGSTNGTFLNGVRITEAVARPGDQVTFGRFAFDLREEAEGAAEPPSSDVAAQALEATVLRRRPVLVPGDLAARAAAAGAARQALAGASPAERQARRLEFLLDAAKALAGQDDLDRLLARLVDLAVGVMDVDRAAILLAGEDGSLATRASRARRGPAVWAVPEAVVRESAEQRLALLVENAGADPRFEGSSGDGEGGRLDSGATAERAGVQSALCAPLLAGDGSLLGLVYLDNLSAPRSFDDEDLDFVVSFAGMAAMALENGRLVERARRKSAVLANFQRYFAPELAEEIAAEQGEVRPGGAKRPVVVLFSDIRGFTALSELMSPDEIADHLNEYFTDMVEIVFEHGGTLDKFMGDAMMALWGAPAGRAGRRRPRGPRRHRHAARPGAPQPALAGRGAAGPGGGDRHQRRRGLRRQHRQQPPPGVHGDRRRGQHRRPAVRPRRPGGDPGGRAGRPAAGRHPPAHPARAARAQEQGAGGAGLPHGVVMD